jgi:hypothetical protein
VIFEDAVRSVEAAAEGRVSVTFKTRSAFYWVSADRTEVVERLWTALRAGESVEVEWDPARLEILSVS